jgi:hypothetical protein
MKGKCLSCKHWNAGHDGVWDSEDWGSCEKINNPEEGKPNLFCIVEGCVDVADRTIDPDYITHKTFGCVQYKTNR